MIGGIDVANVVQEFMKVEEQYIKSLETMVKNIFDPMQRNWKALGIKENTHDELGRHIRQFAKFHRLLYNERYKCITTDEHEKQSIAYLDGFKAYGTYLNTYEDNMDLVVSLQKNKNSKSF
eukprot:TRINITY_DN2701_c0_g1_i1.p1 TRINITY_DN2701_c0_g1~~TRINITY_DN2701_c0_g1_i1.p1  ORF type:complete len:142 (-),score=34.91 TRINITY_DN2701_c0_g1_i1:47-409(-)